MSSDRSEYTVRVAVTEDLESIQAFDEWKAVNAERIRAEICFVAERDARVLAYGILDHSFCRRRFVAILFVHPDHRHRGLGSTLMDHFESIVTEKQLWISTNIENVPMQRMLHQRGYEMSGVIKNLAKIPELFYVKTL